MRPPSRQLLPLIPFVLFFLFWQILAISISHFRSVPFPTPWQTLVRLGQFAAGEPLSDALIYQHISDSLLRWLAGFGIASLIGLIYGLAVGLSRQLELATGQIVHLLQLIPGLAWITIAILMFGVGEPATIFMICMTAFPPIAITVSSGVRHLDSTYLRAARMLGATKRALFFHILLPASLPSAVSGLRLGMGNGWRVLLAAEMVVGTGTGLGYSIVESRWTLDYTAAFACLVVIALFGILVEFGLFRPLEKIALRYFQPEQG